MDEDNSGNRQAGVDEAKHTLDCVTGRDKEDEKETKA